MAYTGVQLKDKDNTVVATARSTAGSSGLQQLKAQDKDGRLILVDLDVSKPESIRAAAAKTTQLLPGGLDNLISNAGVNFTGMETFEEMCAQPYSTLGCFLAVFLDDYANEKGPLGTLNCSHPN
jgi:NAD(P)-dependent dehydrogenase (short-subunit alcohol dehydrogenase family)